MMEAARDYGVRVIRAYQDYRVGQIIFPPGLLRSHLLDAHFVERVESDENRAAKPEKRQARKRG